MIVRCKVLVALLLTVTWYCRGSLAQRIPANPCPAIFDYRFDGQSYFGIISLTGITYGETRVEIRLTQRVTTEFSGKLSLYINKDDVFDYIRTATPILYRVDFPLPNVIPRVTDILVNNVKICSGPEDPPPRSSMTLEHTLRTYSSLSAGSPSTPVRQTRPEPQTPVYNPTNGFGGNMNFDLADLFNQFGLSNGNGNGMAINPFIQNSMNTVPPPTRFIHPTLPTPDPISNFQPRFTQSAITTRAPPIFPGTSSNPFEELNRVCGQENFNIVQLAVNGEEIEKSRFPWIVAIYKRNTSSLSFQCGGSLISSKTVISAAHCFHQGPRKIAETSLMLSVGRHNLNDWQNSINVDIEKLITHPDYKTDFSTFDADLAIVQLKQSVSFSTNVRPICLWQGSTDIRDIEGDNGIIVGWGEDESHTGVIAVPKLVNATIVSEATCLRSHDNFRYLTSNRTLCAGNRDGSGPCMGDSGSGLMVRRGRRWALRGTVSASLSTRSLQCNLYEYVIYCDVAKFIEWIKSNMIV